MLHLLQQLGINGMLQVKEITWDMIHYDVQLIGGMVLHEGKVQNANR
jgi:preprotein translocase subunit SecA